MGVQIVPDTYRDSYQVIAAIVWSTLFFNSSSAERSWIGEGCLLAVSLLAVRAIKILTPLGRCKKSKETNQWTVTEKSTEVTYFWNSESNQWQDKDGVVFDDYRIGPFTQGYIKVALISTVFVGGVWASHKLRWMRHPHFPFKPYFYFDLGVGVLTTVLEGAIIGPLCTKLASQVEKKEVSSVRAWFLSMSARFIAKVSANYFAQIAVFKITGQPIQIAKVYSGCAYTISVFLNHLAYCKAEEERREVQN